MKLRNTIIFLAIGFGLFAYIKWFDKGPTIFEAAETERRPANFDRDSIKTITVRNANGTFEFEQKDDTWWMTSPINDRADSLAISQIFTEANQLVVARASDEAPPKEQLKDFGLAKSDVSVKFGGLPKPVELHFGKDAVNAGLIYVRVEGNELVYVAHTNLRETLARKQDDWRKRTLGDLTSQQIARTLNKIVLKTAKGEIELRKSGDNWSLERPLKSRADNQGVADLIARVNSAHIDEYVADSKDLAAFGLTEPRATLSIYLEDEKEPRVLQIGALKPKPAEEKEKKDEKAPAPAAPTGPSVFVKLSTRSSVVAVPAEIEGLVSLQPSDLRDQNLMRFPLDQADRVTIEAPGKERIVIARKGEDWVRKVDGKPDVPADNVAVMKFVNDLATTRITRNVADMASDMKPFGLDQPQLTVTVGRYSSEGTPETKPGEQVMAKLLLGKFEGDSGYAKLDDEPFIVAAPKSILDAAWTDPVLWQDLRITNFQEPDVTAIEITRAGQPPLSLTLDKDKGWKLAKGEGTVNQNVVRSLVNVLAKLRANRWVSVPNPATVGLDKPNLVVTYTLANKSTGRIVIGRSRNETPAASATPPQPQIPGMPAPKGPEPVIRWFSTLDGKPGSFLMDNADFDAMNAAIVEAPKAAAAPSVTPSTPTPVSTPPVSVPPATEPAKPTEPPKTVEVPSAGAKPASDSAPKLQ